MAGDYFVELWACPPEKDDMLVTWVNGSLADVKAAFDQPEAHFLRVGPIWDGYWVRLTQFAPTWSNPEDGFERGPVVLGQRRLTGLPSKPSTADDLETAHQLGMGLGIAAWNDARDAGGK
jgi:hypothetical protein